MKTSGATVSASGWTAPSKSARSYPSKSGDGDDNDKPFIRRSDSQRERGISRGGDRPAGKSGKSPEDLAEMEKKLFAMRFGAKQ